MGGTIIVPSAGATFPGSGTQTLGKIKGDIATMAGVRDDPAMEGLIAQFLNDIIDDLNRRQTWQFNLITSPDIVTAAGDTTVPAPTDFLSIYGFRKVDSIDYSLSTLRQREFDRLFPSQVGISGFPFVVTVKNPFRDGTLGIFPASDAAHTFRLHYFRLIPRLTQDSDTLDLPIHYESVVTDGARSKILATLSQFDGAKYWGDRFEQGYQTMKRADENAGTDDDELRFLNIEEIAARGISYLSPGARPRALDLW